MDETPDEPRRPDEDWRGQQDDPTATGPLGGQPPPPDQDDDDEEDEYEYEDQAPRRRGILSGRRLAAAGFAVVALLGGGAALALSGGWGDGDDTASSSDDDGSSQEDAAFEFAQCMRDHGIEDFPDPQVNEGGGISFDGPGIRERLDSEEGVAAREACEHILDYAAPEGKQQLTPDELAELQDQWLAVAQCVRDRGYDFADPEVDEYGRFKIRAQGEGVEQAIEECANEIGLGEPQGGEGGSNTGGEGARETAPVTAGRGGGFGGLGGRGRGRGRARRG